MTLVALDGFMVGYERVSRDHPAGEKKGGDSRNGRAGGAGASCRAAGRLQQLQLTGDPERLVAGVGAQFTIKVLEVRLNCVLAHDQRVGDFGSG
jgi:hypothetical protein